MMTKTELLFDCMEEAVQRAKEFAQRGATPDQIAKDLYPDKSSKSWIITVALMTTWWYKLRSADTTTTPDPK